MAIQFQRATKTKAKLRLALAGPAGSGKTFTALTIAASLAAAENGSVAVIDTENGSASKYADIFSFDAAGLTAASGFSPEKYLELLHGAEAAGYPVIVIDSLSHEWAGQDGILQAVDQAAAQVSGNKFVAWRRVTPRHDKLVRAIVESPAHVICTLRAKMEYVQEKNDRGRTEIRAVGMKPIQRDELEYEFDVYGLLDQDNRLIVRKSRCPDLSGSVVDKPGLDVANTLIRWLNSGETAKPTLHVVAASEAAPEADIDAQLQAATDRNMEGFVRPEPTPIGRSEPAVAQPEPTPSEQAHANAAVTGEPNRVQAIRRYKQLAKIAANRKHEAADRINAVDPDTLKDGVLAASIKKLEDFFPGIPELTAEQARDLGL